MAKYKLVSVVWEDHTYVDRDVMVKNPDDGITTDLSVGILYRETPKTLVLVNNVEVYSDRNDSCYTLILKSAILAIKEYGEIELADLTE